MGWLRRKQANPGSAIAQPQPGDALRPAPSDYPEVIPERARRSPPAT